jgi:putative flippase GtrA
VLEGFKRALDLGYGLVMEMDADFSHRPEEVALFLPLMIRYDCVIGSRYLPGSEIREWGWKRTVFSGLANRFARAVLRMPLSDYTNGFRCYTSEAAAAVEPSRIDAKGYVVLSEVAYQLHKKGFRFGEVPTLFVNRRRGVSNLGFHEINEALFSILRIRWPRISGAMQRLLTFLVRGSAGAIVDLVSLAILFHGFSLPSAPAFVASGCIAIGAMLSLRRRRWGAGAGLPLRKLFLLYGCVGVLAVVLAVAIHAAGVPVVVSKAIAIALLSPVSFLLARRLSL